jgi:hypothetical protein
LAVRGAGGREQRSCVGAPVAAAPHCSRGGCGVRPARTTTGLLAGWRGVHRRMAGVYARVSRSSAACPLALGWCGRGGCGARGPRPAAAGPACTRLVGWMLGGTWRAGWRDCARREAAEEQHTAAAGQGDRQRPAGVAWPARVSPQLSRHCCGVVSFWRELDLVLLVHLCGCMLGVLAPAIDVAAGRRLWRALLWCWRCRAWRGAWSLAWRPHCGTPLLLWAWGGGGFEPRRGGRRLCRPGRGSQAVPHAHARTPPHFLPALLLLVCTPTQVPQPCWRCRCCTQALSLPLTVKVQVALSIPLTRGRVRRQRCSGVGLVCVCWRQRACHPFLARDLSCACVESFVSSDLSVRVRACCLMSPCRAALL